MLDDLSGKPRPPSCFRLYTRTSEADRFLGYESLGHDALVYPVRCIKSWPALQNPRGGSGRLCNEIPVNAFTQQSAPLPLALLLYTGQRWGDVIRMGAQHIRNGALRVKQEKTGVELIITVRATRALRNLCGIPVPPTTGDLPRRP
jgi:hypothetical protein